MPEGVAYGPQNTTSVGDLNYIGKHAYAYSGSVDINNNEITMLEFRIGGQYIVSKIQFNYISPDSDNIQYKVYINNQVVQAFQSDAANLTHVFPDSVLHLLVGPYSAVKMTAENVTGSSTRPQAVSFTGRVYGKVD
jgi:hypothetical protein